MDDFREWLSDNLRYFELGGGILLIILLIFFGVRACTGGKKKADSASSNQEQTNDMTEVVDEGDDLEDEQDSTLTEAGEDVTSLIRGYYQALTDKSAEEMRSVVKELSPTDEPVITNSVFENYQLDKVYEKPGLTDQTAFVFATYTYQCPGISTPVPAASSFYIEKDESGNWKINNQASSDPEISSFMSAQMSDPEIQSVTSQVKTAYDSALSSSPELSAYLNGMGETVSSEKKDEEKEKTEDDGPKVIAIDNVNVRNQAGGDDSEVIGELDYGEVVKMLGTEGEWVKIEYNGGTGYVYVEYVEKYSDGSGSASDSGNSDDYNVEEAEYE